MYEHEDQSDIWARNAFYLILGGCLVFILASVLFVLSR
jgi:hypothetical protein